MNKSFKLILLLVCVIAIVGVVYYFRQDDSAKPPVIGGDSGDIGAKEKMAKDVVVQDVLVENYTDNRSIKCVYPKITSLNDKEFENSINKQIVENINAYRDEIEFIVDEETPDVALYKYVTTYDKFVCGKYLSLVINQEYHTGGIRSNIWKDVYNINADTERLFYLEDIFKPGVKYENAIIAEVMKQASEKNYELGGNGYTSVPKKQKFYIQNDKLVIYFTASEVAANVYGELSFEMPFSMNKEGFFEI